MAGNFRRVSGLWLKDGKRGKFFSGKVGDQPIPAGAKLFVFRNDKKQGDSDPDYILNVATDDDAGDRPAKPARRDDPASGDIPF